MQRAVLRQPLDGSDVGAVLHDGKGETGIDAAAVQQHRAGAALAVVAAFLGPGQAQMVAQEVEQAGPRRDRQLALHTVHMERDRHFGGR